MSVAIGATVLTVASGGQKLLAAKRVLEDGFERYQQKNTETWWLHIVEQFQARTPVETRDDIEQKLHALASRDHVLKVLSQSWRSMMDALDDAVIPILGCLTAEYLALDIPPDAYYRGMCRVLSDLSFEEFQAFQKIALASLTVIDGLAASGYLDLIAAEIRYDRDDQRVKVNGWIEGKGATVIKRLDNCTLFERINHLLQTHGLASAVHPVGNANGFGLDIERLRRIAKLISPSA